MPLCAELARLLDEPSTQNVKLLGSLDCEVKDYRCQSYQGYLSNQAYIPIYSKIYMDTLTGRTQLVIKLMLLFARTAERLSRSGNNQTTLLDKFFGAVIRRN